MMMSVHKNKMDEGSESKSQEMKQEADWSKAGLVGQWA